MDVRFYPQPPPPSATDPSRLGQSHYSDSPYCNKVKLHFKMHAFHLCFFSLSFACLNFNADCRGLVQSLLLLHPTVTVSRRK